jgi:hypothetical protein
MRLVPAPHSYPIIRQCRQYCEDLLPTLHGFQRWASALSLQLHACPCCMSLLHVPATCPCCMYLLHISAACSCWFSMLLVHVVCPCCMTSLNFLVCQIGTQTKNMIKLLDMNREVVSDFSSPSLERYNFYCYFLYLFTGWTGAGNKESSGNPQNAL